MQIAQVEVPAEIVGIIAHHLFCLEGMQETWKLRLVCTTFASAIKDDILLYQTEELRYANGRWCGSIMSHLMPEWLYYRVKKPVDSMSSLSANILDIHSYICQELDIAKAKKEEKLLDVCAAMAKTITFPDLSHAIRYPYSTESYCDLHHQWCETAFYSGLTSEEKVAAATALGDYEMCEDLLPQLGEHDMAVRRMSPLLAAVVTDDQDTLQLILDHAKRRQGKSTLESLYIPYAFRLAIHQHSAGAVGRLTEFLKRSYHDHKGVRDVYVQSLREAVKFVQPPNAEIVRQMVLNAPYGPKVSADVFLYACKTHSLDIVKVLLSEGQVDVNKGSAQTLPLHVAIKTSDDDTAIIGAVLDAGADINKTGYPTTKSRKYCGVPAQNQSPLEFAAAHSMAAVKYLIQRGAIVRHVDLWYTISEPEPYNALRDARIKQTGDEVPNFLESQDRMEQDEEAYLQSEEDRLEKLRTKHRI
ncbi:hypothetical protein J4E91_004514 [Alternaria rosae]|nr:hypothetical protein J4E91_004514 [Alternaria rosae]